MADQPPWKVDVASLRTAEIIELLKQLSGSRYREVNLELRAELIKRARLEGASDETIIRNLTRAVPRGLRLNAIAEEWAGSLGLSVKEFKRIANAR